MEKLLPKTANQIANGGLYHQAVRCGKPNCRCARGELHLGYFYFFTRIEGRQKKIYVPKHLVRSIAALAADAKSARRKARQLMAESIEALRDIKVRLRKLQAIG